MRDLVLQLVLINECEANPRVWHLMTKLKFVVVYLVGAKTGTQNN